MRLLVVEDNVSLLESIKAILNKEFDVDCAMNGAEGMYMALRNIYDAIILDVMLPEMDGFVMIQKLRKSQVKTPVLFLTAKDSVEDRVKGLDLGGDDYLVKPFQVPELQARIRALLRRSGSLSLNQKLCYRGMELHGKEHDITVDGQAIKLTIKQYELLEYLVQNVGAILTKEQMYDRVWGFDSDTTIAIVEVFIHQIRKKLEIVNYHKDIQTVRGIGYMLKEFVYVSENTP